VEMFPEEFLRNSARASGFIIRRRKIDLLILFWVLTLGFGVRFLSTIRGLKRKYEAKAGVKLSISSFYERFTPKMVGLISFRDACSMRLSLEHSNPVVFWAINTPVETLAQRLHPAPRSQILQVLFFDRIARYGCYFVSKLIFKELKSHYRMDLIPSANPEPVECMIWIAILTLMCSRKILRLIQNANCSLCTTFTPARDAIPMSNERG